MSDSDSVVLTAVELLEKLRAEQEIVVARYRANHGGPGAWQELADGDFGDRGAANQNLEVAQIENAADRGKLELIGDAIQRIEANPAQFDACQAVRCLGTGHIEHERLEILPWAKFCCACAAAQQRR